MTVKENPAVRANAPTGQIRTINNGDIDSQSITETQAFLSWLRPNDHLLTAIPPDGGPTVSRHFARADDPDIVKFVEHVQERGMGVYFALNPPATDRDRKARREDIAHAAWLHCDLDPPGGMGRDEGRSAILAKLSELPFYLPRPTVIDSGNGFQALWRLEQPCDLDAAEGVNRAVAAALGGDTGTWDASRILRLPGTTNFPNAKKRAAGRVATPARLVETGQPVSLDMMAGAFPPMPAPAAKVDAEADIDFAAVFACGDLADLPAGLASRFRAACERDTGLASLWAGEPLQHMHDASRSGFRFALATRLWAANVFDETEIATLLWVAGPHTGGADAKTERTLSRDVARSRRISAADEFEAIEELDAPTDSFPWIDVGNLDFDHVPPRQWLYPDLLLRKFVTSTVAAGGIGKSTITLVEAMALASNRPLLGVSPFERCRAAVWNGEDPLEEMHRRLIAAARLHGVTQAELADWLFLQSGRDHPMILAATGENGRAVLNAGTRRRIVASLKAREIDALIIDPFVSSHAVSENDNNAMDAVVKAWGAIADEANCAVHLVHHTRKTNGAEATMEDSRGGAALIAGVRVGRVLSFMSREEAAKAGVTNPRRFVKTGDGKANLAAASNEATWFRLEGVDLDNADANGRRDNVGVAVAWAWPAITTETDMALVAEVQEAVAGGEYRADSRSGEWVGKVVADALGLDLQDSGNMKRVKTLIARWRQEGWLREEQRPDKRREMRAFVVVGKPALDSVD